MATIPSTFSTETGAIASYDFNDFAAGTGIQTFFGFNRSKPSSDVNSYALSTASPYSDLVSSSGNISVNNLFNCDFDTEEFLLPRIVKGTATINVPWRVVNSSSSNNNYVQCALKKYDGTTATTIATASGAIKSSASGIMRVELIQIRDIDPYPIPAGNKLRLTVSVDANTAGNSPIAHIGHDPQNRADDYFTTGNFPTTTLKAWIPFLLDA